MDDPRRTTEADPRLRGSHAEGQRESGWDNWWTSDRLDAVGWAAIFIWGAVVVFATYTDFSGNFSWWDGWGVFFVGAGVIVFVESGARLFLAEYRSKLSWTFAWGMVFLSIGLGTLFGPAWLALALVAIAFVILAGALRGRT